MLDPSVWGQLGQNNNNNNNIPSVVTQVVGSGEGSEYAALT